MDKFNRYTRVRELMEAGLSRKTSWGRNETMHLLNTVLVGVAEEEIELFVNRSLLPQDLSFDEISEDYQTYLQESERT